MIQNIVGIVLAAVVANLAPSVAVADFAAGMAAAVKGDFATALVEWEPLAATGDMDAQMNLGMMYERGAGMDRDPAMALVLFTAAANQGHSLAAYKVGLAHQLGLGIPVDFAAALTWFRVSAENGYSGGVYELGYSYYQGEGVAADPQEALKWFYAANEMGWPNARPATNFTERQLDQNAIEAARLAAAAWLDAHQGVLAPGR
jgi:TPR repeat protein